MMAVVSDPEQATEVSLRDLYRQHRWDLVRLASLLVHDSTEAEEVVQDAFVRTLVAWNRMRDKGKALPYLRSAVLNGARSRLRHLKVVERTPTTAAHQSPSPEQSAVSSDEQARVLDALRVLPTRQRECLVLRYYLDLSEAEIAATLDISPGSVKTHVHRGMAALAERLDREDHR